MTKEQWIAIKNRDASFDGIFYYGLKTTKHICKPSCSTRSGNPKNIVIFDNVEEGIAAGYTPCRRCRPEIPDWRGTRAELADKAEKYMEAHYQEKFSLKKIAEQFFVNESYLLRVFKEVKGVTMLKCHNRIRCAEAQKLLIRNELSISYIGDAVGFTSAPHFARIFRKETGLSPSEWRKNYLKDLLNNTG